MGYLYVDDSIHDRDGFALAGLVYSARSMSFPVARALRAAGLVPGREEFKSGARMHSRPALQTLREILRTFVERECRVGVVVAPVSARPELDVIALRGVAHVLSANGLAGTGHCIAVDEHLGTSVQRARAFAQSDPVLAKQDVRLEQDSKRVLGIQLADLVAHTCATMLRAALGRVPKTVRVLEEPGGTGGQDAALGFVLWAGVRYALFRQPLAGGRPMEPIMDATPGLYIDERCSPQLRAAADARGGRAPVRARLHGMRVVIDHRSDAAGRQPQARGGPGVGAPNASAPSRGVARSASAPVSR